MNRVVVFGPGPKFKGGIANYNTSLAKAFDKLGIEVHIVSWTQQYPAIIPRDFIDRKSRHDLLQGTGIKVHYITNYNNPFTWNKTYKLIRNLKPDMAVFQWAIAVQGLPMGHIAGKLRKRTRIEVVFDLHFVIQKEGSTIDNLFTKMGIKYAHTYVVHAFKTADELKKLFPFTRFKLLERNKSSQGEGKPVIKLFHPVYDMFAPVKDFDKLSHKKLLKLNEYVFLFFGFIRKYKGLHNVISAFAKVVEARDDVSLLIVGESFWQTLDNRKFSTQIKNFIFGLAKSVFLRRQDDEKDYRPIDLIAELGIAEKVTVINDFVPNEDVYRYFQVSDAIMLYYLTATPSGVESIAYNFGLPMLATKVGHFPETIQDGINGYLAERDDIESMARAMIKIIEQPVPPEHVYETSREMSWLNYAKAIMELR